MSMKNIEDVYRLSPRQHDVLVRRGSEEADAPVSLLHFGVRGPIEDSALDLAAHELLRRHPALRTAFFPKGLKEPVQVVRDKVGLTIARDDWSSLSAAQQRHRMAERLATERVRAFNIASAPLMRLSAIRLAPEHHHFIWTHHPLILDEPSILRCLEELFTLHRSFAAGDAPVHERGLPYREYVAWIESESLLNAESAFRGLGDSPAPTRLDAAPLSGAPREHVTQQIALSQEATGLVQATLKQHRLSLGALIEGAWAVLLAEECDAREVLFGAGVSGRPSALGRSEGAVGCYAGALPRRVVLPPPSTSLVPWLQRLKADGDAIRAFAHVSIEQVRAWTGRARSQPLFESVVTADGPPDQDARGPRFRTLGLREIAYQPAPDCALAVRAELGQRLLLRIRYDAARFASSAIARLVAHLAALVEAIATTPETSLDALPRIAPSMPRPPATGSTPTGMTGFTTQDIEAILLQHPRVGAVMVSRRDVGADGARLVARVTPKADRGRAAHKKLDFSMFYFADANAGASEDKYRLYLEGASFADRNGFAAVWTPERHFHENGGLYPNPAVLSAALATVTSRVSLRAGSVVVPIHHPLRIAEEWSVVDNLSRGRVGLSVASGWVPNDFAFAPHNYEDRREAMLRGIEQVRTLWAGGTIPAKDGAGKEVALRVFPRPIQRELPLWLTAAGSPDTFEKAGELGFNILTSIMAQSIDEAGEKIALYRAARARAGHDPRTGIVTMMVHTFIGDDADDVLEKVREPFTAYLRSHVGLMKTMVESLDLAIDINEPKWLDYLASFAFERYSRQGALLGTPTSCLPLVERLAAIDVDEVACLIDFGVDADEALLGQRLLTEYLAERLPGLAAEVDIRWSEPRLSSRAVHGLDRNGNEDSPCAES
jgi:natural product biosynthesis luciferase-like monooxygenase protein